MTTEPTDFAEPPAPAPVDPILAKMREFRATGLSSWTEYQAVCAMGQIAVDALIQATMEREDEIARLHAGYAAWVGTNPQLLGELIGEAGGSLAMDMAALQATRDALRRRK